MVKLKYLKEKLKEIKADYVNASYLTGESMKTAKTIKVVKNKNNIVILVDDELAYANIDGKEEVGDGLKKLNKRDVDRIVNLIKLIFEDDVLNQ